MRAAAGVGRLARSNSNMSTSTNGSNMSTSTVSGNNANVGAAAPPERINLSRTAAAVEVTGRAPPPPSPPLSGGVAAAGEGAADSGTSIRNMPAFGFLHKSINAAESERIESRFDTLFRLTGYALGESKQLGIRELEGTIAQKKVVGETCATLPHEVIVNLVFIRHSESCANVLKRNTTFGGLAQKGYTDPELSERGIQMAIDRAKSLTEILPRDVENSPWIVGCSTLFRAEQTAMYLSNGISNNRASDQIVVLPYIQETGSGKENVALTEIERSRVESSDPTKLPINLYEKLPGGISSRKRIITTLFDSAENPSQPSVDRFFKWLGCNLALINHAGRGMPNVSLPHNINMLVVTHSNWMTALYNSLRDPRNPMHPSSIKYDNLEAINVSIRYNPNSALTQKPTIIYPKHTYTPSPALIKASCPDSVCRKPVCPKGAIAAPTGVADRHPYQEVCDAIEDLNVPPTNSATYTSRIKGPIVDKLSANMRNSVKRARKTLAAYDPPGTFRGIFGARPRSAEQLAANKTSALRDLACPRSSAEVIAARRQAGESAQASQGLLSSMGISATATPTVAPRAAPPNTAAALFEGTNIAFYGGQGGARLRRHRRMTRHHRTPTRIGRRTQKCRH